MALFGAFQNFKKQDRTMILLMVFAIALGTMGVGCARQNTPGKVVLRECVLPADQSGTLEGIWRVTPVPIAFHEGDFSPEEMQAMAKGASTWNKFSQASLGYPLLDFGDFASPRTVVSGRPQTVCSQSIIAGDDYSAPVGIFKQTQWPYSSQSAIAITSLCPDRANAGSGYAKFFMAAIELNYQNFFVANKRMPDLQSIVAHELGHLIGLRHSCEAVGRKGMPNCTDGGINPEYISALLYPVFGFDETGIGEQRRDLNNNDQGRTNCLYKEE